MATATAARRESPRTGQVFLYFGPLALVVYLVMPHGYLLDIATSYVLKTSCTPRQRRCQRSGC
jgi:hypothetical protein